MISNETVNGIKLDSYCGDSRILEKEKEKKTRGKTWKIEITGRWWDFCRQGYEKEEDVTEEWSVAGEPLVSGFDGSDIDVTVTNCNNEEIVFDSHIEIEWSPFSSDCSLAPDEVEEPLCCYAAFYESVGVSYIVEADEFDINKMEFQKVSIYGLPRSLVREFDFYDVHIYKLFYDGKELDYGVNEVINLHFQYDRLIPSKREVEVVCDFSELLEEAQKAEVATHFIVSGNGSADELETVAGELDHIAFWLDLSAVKGIETINYETFSGRDIAEIILPDGVGAIGEEAFSYCYLLKNIFIPDSVKYIAHNAFDGCISLKSIEISEDCEIWYDMEIFRRV